MLANVFVLGVLSASAYLIYLVVKRSDEREKEGKPPTVLEQYEVRKNTGLNSKTIYLQNRPFDFSCCDSAVRPLVACRVVSSRMV